MTNTAASLVTRSRSRSGCHFPVKAEVIHTSERPQLSHFFSRRRTAAEDEEEPTDLKAESVAVDENRLVFFCFFSTLLRFQKLPFFKQSR